MLPRAVEKKSVCGCSFVSSHDVHKSHIAVASGEAILADISVAVLVAKYVACECKCRDMDAIDCSPTVLEEGVLPRVPENLLRDLIDRVFDIFFVERGLLLEEEPLQAKMSSCRWIGIAN
jgi:hypothetical protein